MKISPKKQRTALAGALRQMLKQRGSSAIGDVGDYLLARLLAEDGGGSAREAAATRAAGIAGISGLGDMLDIAYQALRQHHALLARLPDWGRDLAAAALEDCERLSGLYGGQQQALMEQAADFTVRTVLPEIALRSAITVSIANDPTGLCALTIHDALLGTGALQREEFNARIVFDVTTTSPDFSNLAYVQLALSGLAAVCRCRNAGTIMQPDARTPAWRSFSRLNGTGLPHVLTFVPAPAGTADDPVQTPPRPVIVRS